MLKILSSGIRNLFLDDYLISYDPNTRLKCRAVFGAKQRLAAYGWDIEARDLRAIADYLDSDTITEDTLAILLRLDSRYVLKYFRFSLSDDTLLSFTYTAHGNLCILYITDRNENSKSEAPFLDGKVRIKLSGGKTLSYEELFRMSPKEVEKLKPLSFLVETNYPDTYFPSLVRAVDL